MATNKQLFSIQKYLSSSAVDKFKLERVFEVNKAKTPQLYNDIVNDVQFLENNGLFILIDGEDVQVKYANGIKVWSDALTLGGGGSEPTEITWSDIQDKPATFAPIIGTTATTALAGNTAIPTPATVAPLVNGTATVGTSALYARQDHVHPLQTSVATLATGRTFSLSGGATGTSGTFNGSANSTIPVTLATPTIAVRGGVLQAPAQTDSVATDVEGLVADFNALLAKLRTAGVIA